MATDERLASRSLFTVRYRKKKYAMQSVECASGRYRVSLIYRILGWIKTDALVDDIEFDEAILFWVSDYSDGVESLLDNLDLLFEKSSQRYNAFIGGSETLASSICNRSLSLPGHRVLRGNRAQVVIALAFL
jgi:hypothetical protein